MIAGAQIRSTLRWNAEELAQKADVATKTVRRLENIHGIPNTTVVTLAKIQTALEVAGIELIGTPADGPGIRLHT